MNKQSLIEENGIGLFPMDGETGAEKQADHADSPSFLNRPLNGLFKPCAVSEVNGKATEDPGKEGDENADQSFIIRELSSGKTIGQLRIVDIASAHQTAWMNMIMDGGEVFDAHARDVLRMVLRYGFVNLDFNRVCVEIPAFEETEIALYEEAGFLRETQRRQAVYYNGSHYDDLLYGILRTEWMKIEQEVAA